MNEHGNILHRRYRWHPWHQVRYGTIPSRLRNWLLDPASLTSRLQQVCGKGFHVRVAGQGWRRPSLHEAHALQLHHSQTAWVREVHLFCDDTPLVFARTVIPRKTLRGRERRLAHLGRRPLGAVLFADPRMKRGTVELARIPAESRLFEIATRHLATKPAEIWGRRSVFQLHRKSLLVSEIFLPTVGRFPG